MTAPDGYALDLVTPARHVVAELAKADSPLPARHLARSYVHPIPADLARVRWHEGLRSDDDARIRLICWSLDELGAQIERSATGGRFSLAVPPGEVRFRGRPLQAFTDEHARLGDPFNPHTGAIFTGGMRAVRGRTSSADDDLRESMRLCGWIPGLPAIRDERGVVIIGHRRLRIAAQLGITPVVQVHMFGHGDAADIERLAWAWCSNEGGRPYAPGDRQEMAAYLAEQGWPQQGVMTALAAAQEAIRAGQPVPVPEQQSRPQEKLPSVPLARYRGRPRMGSGKRKWSQPALVADVQEYLAAGLPLSPLAGRHGVSTTTLETTAAYVQGLRDGQAMAESREGTGSK